MDSRRVALLLVVVGLLCLPAPLYLGWAAQATAPPAQTSQIYSAEPIDLDNASDRKRFVDAHGHEVAVSDYRITAPYSDEYHAPNATLDALVTAMREGSATVDDPDARADLRAIDAEYRFVRDTNDGTEPDGYYRFSVGENGSVVRAENVSLRPVADAIAEQAPRYANLSPGEQRTVDRIVDNSTGDEWGYRPRVDEPYVDQLPTAIHEGDTLYSISVSGHADDFGPGFAGFVVGMGVTVLGAVLLLAGVALYAYDRWW